MGLKKPDFTRFGNFPAQSRARSGPLQNWQGPVRHEDGELPEPCTPASPAPSPAPRPRAGGGPRETQAESGCCLR